MSGGNKQSLEIERITPIEKDSNSSSSTTIPPEFAATAQTAKQHDSDDEDATVITNERSVFVKSQIPPVQLCAGLITPPFTYIDKSNTILCFIWEKGLRVQKISAVLDRPKCDSVKITTETKGMTDETVKQVVTTINYEGITSKDVEKSFTSDLVAESHMKLPWPAVPELLNVINDTSLSFFAIEIHRQSEGMKVTISDTTKHFTKEELETSLRELETVTGEENVQDISKQ